MQKFDYTVEMQGIIHGFKKVAILNEDLKVIGVNHQLWIEDHKGIFRFKNEHKTLYDNDYEPYFEAAKKKLTI